MTVLLLLLLGRNVDKIHKNQYVLVRCCANHHNNQDNGDFLFCFVLFGCYRLSSLEGFSPSPFFFIGGQKKDYFLFCIKNAVIVIVVKYIFFFFLIS